MEDTKSLLIMVLQKIFQNQPKIVEDTYQLIYNFNNGKKEKNQYEKTLKTICELMNDKLPAQILVYLLTLVDMPKEDGCQLPIMEKMQKTQNCLPETVRPHLLEYLRKPKEMNNSEKDKDISGNVDEKKKCDNNKPEPIDDQIKNMSKRSVDSDFVKPSKRPRIKKKVGKVASSEISEERPEPMKSLLDLTAVYVVRNEQKLKQMYKNKLEQAWRLINSDFYSGNNLKICYEVVRDLNKKTKLLRMIENDNITEDIFFDEYQESDIFLKEKHVYDLVHKDPFKVPNEVMRGIMKFLDQK